jgi:hypothetical protein
MRRICLFAMAVLTVSASAGFAKDKPTDAQAADGSAPKEKKICHSEPMTGSLTRVNRVCMTAAEWDQLSDKTNKTVNDINSYQNRPDRVPANPGAAQGFGG